MFDKLVNIKFKDFFYKKLLRLDSHTIEVFQKSASSILVKLIGMFAGLLVSVFLGRTIGADGLGIINLANRIVNILIVVGLMGMSQVIVKEVAIARCEDNYEHIGNVMHSSFWLNGIITFLISIVVIFLSPWIANYLFNDYRLKVPLVIMVAVLTLQVFSRIFSSGLIGYKKIWQSNLVEQTLSIVITGIGLVIIWLVHKKLSINLVALLYAIGRVSVTFVIFFIWKNNFKNYDKPKIISKSLLNTSIPLFMGTIASIIMNNSDVILLGLIGNSKEVGLYSVAARIALLSSFILQISNSAISPKAAALYRNGKLNELETMVQHVTKGLSFIGLVQFAIVFCGGKFFLKIWGNEFINAYWILIILSLGQLINIGTGAVGTLLIMCGYEKIQSKIASVFAFISILLNYYFVINWGVLGLSISTSISIAGINFVRVIFVKRKMKILAVPFFKTF